MSDKWLVIQLTKALTGKPPTSQDSIKNACFADKVKDPIRPNQSWYVAGYGDMRAAFDCDGEGCLPSKGSTNQNWAKNAGK